MKLLFGDCESLDDDINYVFIKDIKKENNVFYKQMRYNTIDDYYENKRRKISKNLFSIYSSPCWLFYVMKTFNIE